MDDWRVLDVKPGSPEETRETMLDPKRNVAIIATRVELDDVAEAAWRREGGPRHVALEYPNGERNRDTGRRQVMPDPALVLFGRYVRRSRRIVQMSQQRLAYAVGVSQSTISRLENGKAPSLGVDRLVAIAEYLGRAMPLGTCPHEHYCPWQPIAEPEPVRSHVEALVAALLHHVPHDVDAEDSNTDDAPGGRRPTA
jgi:transcriptional regulator with XRE-family HTH domain